ncbi:Hypothetical protein, putative [Bodo saltans]|uniref:SET domain-containing protein n=1 Tax=Bodo saltans TaxID=75058 RepID=A0A0S4J9V9_BODSA|nr:Hypothetical protein, putative [Bodo saltans]|eukprot:CUG88197.1 Hypothetical protein, putative [Bodo saltans]
MTSYLGVEPDHKKFALWAKKRDIFLNPDVAFLVPTKRMGLGVYALKPLKKGSTIISCPLASAISPYEKNVETSTSPSASAIAAAIPQSKSSSGGGSSGTLHNSVLVDNTLRVCLRLMSELSRPKSTMRPWLECCPRMPTHLFGLSQEVLERIDLHSAAQCTQWSNVGQQFTEINADALWERAQRIIAEYPDIWPADICTAELFAECLTQILSRNFHREEVPGQEGPYLLPGVDFVNHSFTQTNAEFTMHGGGRAHNLSFDVMALRDIAKGEQVYYNYGPISEARFFLEFQFLNEIGGNPHDALRFSWNALESLARATLDSNLDVLAPAPSAAAKAVTISSSSLASRIKKLQRLSLWNDEGLFVTAAAPVNPDDEAATAASSNETDPSEGTTSASVRTYKGFSSDLWNAVYLLTSIDDRAFEDIENTLSRHWECSKSVVKSPVVRNMKVLIGLRAGALSAALQKIEQALGDATFMATLAQPRHDAIRMLAQAHKREERILQTIVAALA